MTTARHFLSDRPPTARFKHGGQGWPAHAGYIQTPATGLALDDHVERDYFGLAEKWLSLSAKGGLCKGQADHVLIEAVMNAVFAAACRYFGFSAVPA